MRKAPHKHVVNLPDLNIAELPFGFYTEYELRRRFFIPLGHRKEFLHQLVFVKTKNRLHLSLEGSPRRAGGLVNLTPSYCSQY